MNMKNDVDVIINGKKYTLSGYESEDYLQRIATFINNKYSELTESEGWNHLSAEMRDTLMQINLADEYMKQLTRNEELEKEIDDKNKEIFNLKQDLITKKEEERKNR